MSDKPELDLPWSREGRTILLLGKRFVTIHKEEAASPTQCDTFVQNLVDLLNGVAAKVI